MEGSRFGKLLALLHLGGRIGGASSLVSGTASQAFSERRLGGTRSPMTSKSKIIETFARAYEALSALALPDPAPAHVRQLHRAFTDLRHHDSEQAKALEETRASMEARERRMAELQREAQEAMQAGKTKDAKLLAKDARIAALEREVRALERLVRERMLSSSEAEEMKKGTALDRLLEKMVKQLFEECNPTQKVMRIFHRCGRAVIDECTKDVREADEALFTYQQLVAAACLQYGPLTLPQRLPDEVLDAVQFSLTKLDGGQWLVEVRTDAKPVASGPGSALP
jgi:hypothetical protein